MQKDPTAWKKCHWRNSPFFTDYLTSAKHRPESPMSCTYWTMNFSEKYYLTAKIIKPAWQPVSKGNINLSFSFRSSSVTDNAGKTRGLFFLGFYVNCYWVWCGKCKSYKINNPICFKKNLRIMRLLNNILNFSMFIYQTQIKNYIVWILNRKTIITIFLKAYQIIDYTLLNTSIPPIQWSFASLINVATEKVLMKHIIEMKILHFSSEKKIP